MPGAPAAAGWRAFLAVQVIVVAWLALMPSPPPPEPSFGDKLEHMAAFAVMTVTGVNAFGGRWRPVALALLAYGALIELAQSFTATRTAEWGDLLADAAGIAAGLGVARLLQRRRAR